MPCNCKHLLNMIQINLLKSRKTFVTPLTADNLRFCPNGASPALFCNSIVKILFGQNSTRFSAKRNNCIKRNKTE